MRIAPWPAVAQEHGRAAGLVCLLECGPGCSCGQHCGARLTQQGLSVKVLLTWDENKVSGKWGRQVERATSSKTYGSDWWFDRGADDSYIGMASIKIAPVAS